MKKSFVMGALLSLFVGYSQAQVKDVSVTVSPTVEYTWWNNKTILKDTPLIGGRVGFGFGRYFEVRGLYMKSVNLKAKLEDVNMKYVKGLTNEIAKDMEDTKVDVTRFGGELKANIALTSKFAPYITLGTGVQKFEFKRENQKLDDYEEEQVYASAGLGIKLNLSDRMVLALEGRNTMFNMNQGNPYLKADAKVDGDDKRLNNWSALASLEFYLGGRNPNEMSELDKAYQRSLRGGMSQFKFVAEPGGMYINFDEDSPFSDSYFLGGGLGFDISDYIGVRGFYYQATEDRKLKLKFNSKQQIFGGNILARLNSNASGISPYISLGGGYIKVADDFTNEEGVIVDEGAGFAMGGVGIEIPLSKKFMAYGSANYMLTSSKDVKDENITSPSELHKNMAYRAGIRFQLGGKAQNPNAIIDARLNSQKSELEQAYEARIKKLNEELDKAYARNDVNGAVGIIGERDRLEKELRSGTTGNGWTTSDDNMVRMSREEFETLVNEVIRKIDEENVFNAKILEELKSIKEQINENSKAIKAVEKSTKTVAPTNTKVVEVKETVIKKVDANGNPIAVEQKKEQAEKAVEKKETLTHDGLAVITGPSFGKEFTWGVGLRSYYNIKDTENVQFVPEVFLGGWDKTTWGVSGNAIYKFSEVKKGKMVNPYVGAGLGLFKYEKTRFGLNLIVGTEIELKSKGKLFVDYSSRNFFKNNHFVVGYRFVF